MKHKAGFTKKDVFVVLGCVVFVLANLGAVGSTGRRRAKEAVCLSNLKQWGVIWKAYVDDHNGYFADTTGNGNGGEVDSMIYWPETVQAYYENAKLMLCPEATRVYGQGGHPPFSAWNDYREPPHYGSYGINLWLATCEDCIRSADKFWRTPYVGDAACVPLMFDSNWRDVESEPYDEAPEYDGYWWEPNANEMKRVCINRHLGAVNIVFLDFSVRKVGLKKLWKLKWHRKWTEDAYPSGGWPPWMENFKDY